MKRSLKWIIGGAVIVLALLQLRNPAHTNPPLEPGQDLLASNAPPAEIVAMLRAACYDCHSYETKWLWYSRIAPASWWIIDHVEEGRDHLNFSDWSHYDPAYASKMWNRVGKEVRSGEMPLPSYTWIHTEARLTPAQRKQLADWALQQAQRLDSIDAGEKQP